MNTLDQSFMALGQANKIRMARADRRKDLANMCPKRGMRQVIEWLGSPPPELARMKVRDLLKAIHRWGDAKADEILLRARVSAVVTIGDLTERQRAALITHLERRDEAWGLEGRWGMDGRAA